MSVLNIIPGTVVTHKALVAYKAELAVAASIVLDAGAGVYGAVIPAGTILSQQVNGRYLPAAAGDAVTIGQTKILAQTITVDGSPTPNVAGFYAGYFNVAALVGTTAQIAALGIVNEPGVLHMKEQ